MRSKQLKKCHLFVLMLFNINILFAQMVHDNVGMSLTKSFPSPDVASIAKFGEFSANPFNGKVNISVPIYNVSYKDLSIPISLDYSSEGIRPDDHPGWVGLGWTLKTGGVVSRKVVGYYDEHVKEVPPIGSGSSFQYNYEIGYLYNCGKNAESWSDQTFLVSHLQGTIPEFDSHPDEFYFNFNGYSGTFYFTRPYHNGPLEIKCKPNGAYHLKVAIEEIKDYIEFDDFRVNGTGEFVKRTSSRLIYRISITDDQGIKYIFGGNDNSIEFSNNGDLNPGKPQYNVPTSWHLTQVISPFGYSVNFNYKRVGRVFIEHKQRNLTAYRFQWNYLYSIFDGLLYQQTVGNELHTGVHDNISIVIINPVYLESIVTPKQTITFSTNATTQLKYPCYSSTPSEDRDKLMDITDVDGSLHIDGHLSTWQKLTEINIGNLYKVKFDYIEATDKRLRLNKIDFVANEIVDNSYSFAYQPGYLPTYLSKRTDHWGYLTQFTHAYDDNYLLLREPNALSLQIEMLSRISFPTGGYTEFEFEPHEYSMIANQFPFNAPTINPYNKIAGGLRIKKITSVANFNAELVIKEYFYKSNYISNGEVSSGILSGRPQYANSGTVRSNHTWAVPLDGSATSDYTLSYGTMVDNNILFLSENFGDHVGYSEITEKTAAGYTVYKYTNHDETQYRDEPPAHVYTNYSSKYHEEYFIRRNYYRGLLKSQQLYNINKNLVQETINDYYIDTETSYFKVPWIYRLLKTLGSVEMGRISSGVHYIKPPLIKQEITKTYSGSSFSTLTKDYYYAKEINLTSYQPANDNFKPKKIVTTNSKGEIKTALFKHSVDIGGSSTTSQGLALTALISGNVWAPTLYSIDQLGTKILSHSFATYRKEFNVPVKDEEWTTEFGTPYTGTINTGIVSGTLQQDPNLKSQTKYDFYDSYGNLLQYTTRSMTHSLIWDYQKEFPVARIMNAQNQHVAYSSFEADGVGNWNYTGSVITDHSTISGNKIYKLTGNSISKSGLNSSINYYVSYWSKSGSYTVSGTQSGWPKLIRTINGWNCYEHKVSGITTVTVSGSGFIDELRLVPDKSMMVTYTFDPVRGMTSEIDVNHNILFYTYDHFGRLMMVRDEHKNILKKYCYNYVNQAQTCVWYGNQLTNQAFTKSCSSGYSGSSVTYTVPANTYYSTTQMDANNMAQVDVNANGQAYANALGTCTQQTIYAKIFNTNVYNDYDNTYATVLIKFFSDAACTIPVSVSNLTVNYKRVRINCNGTSPLTSNFSVNCSGTQHSLGSQIIYTDDGIHCWNFTFSTTAGNGYVPK